MYVDGNQNYAFFPFRSSNQPHCKQDVSMYIESSAFKELRRKIRSVWPDLDRRLVTVQGSKGFGKTCCLKLMSKEFKDNVIYVDLKMERNLEFLDSFSEKKSTKEYRFVAAAYSPNAMACNSNLISELSGFIGSANVPFYITPWTKDDIEAVLKKHDFTVCTDTTDVSISITSLQQAKNDKKFTQLQFDRLYYNNQWECQIFHRFFISR